MGEIKEICEVLSTISISTLGGFYARALQIFLDEGMINSGGSGACKLRKDVCHRILLYCDMQDFLRFDFLQTFSCKGYISL